ncbi:MAG: hypothetical protein ACTSP4_02930 [Candidatus Hodarchaeales archaeon]
MSEELKSLLPETEGFPVGSGLKVLRGRTLTKTTSWWKAVVLIETAGKKQIRLYGWQKDKEGNYKVRQKFNISRGYSTKLARVLKAFAFDAAGDTEAKE